MAVSTASIVPSSANQPKMSYAARARQSLGSNSSPSTVVAATPAKIINPPTAPNYKSTLAISSAVPASVPVVKLSPPGSSPKATGAKPTTPSSAAPTLPAPSASTSQSSPQPAPFIQPSSSSSGSSKPDAEDWDAVPTASASLKSEQTSVTNGSAEANGSEEVKEAKKPAPAPAVNVWKARAEAAKKVVPLPAAPVSRTTSRTALATESLNTAPSATESKEASFLTSTTKTPRAGRKSSTSKNTSNRPAVQATPNTIPSLEDTTLWPSPQTVSPNEKKAGESSRGDDEASVAGSVSTAGGAGGRKEKTKWVTISPIELQRSADAQRQRNRNIGEGDPPSSKKSKKAANAANSSSNSSHQASTSANAKAGSSSKAKTRNEEVRLPPRPEVSKLNQSNATRPMVFGSIGGESALAEPPMMNSLNLKMSAMMGQGEEVELDDVSKIVEQSVLKVNGNHESSSPLARPIAIFPPPSQPLSLHNNDIVVNPNLTSSEAPTFSPKMVSEFALPLSVSMASKSEESSPQVTQQRKLDSVAIGRSLSAGAASMTSQVMPSFNGGRYDGGEREYGGNSRTEYNGGSRGRGGKGSRNGSTRQSLPNTSSGGNGYRASNGFNNSSRNSTFTPSYQGSNGYDQSTYYSPPLTSPHGAASPPLGAYNNIVYNGVGPYQPAPSFASHPALYSSVNSVPYSPQYTSGANPSIPYPHVAPPMPVPVTGIPFQLDPQRFYLLGQLEYYFSLQNLAMDFFLRQQMDSRGWIDISMIASFKRVKYLTADLDWVKETMSLSSLTEIKGDKVRLGHGYWKQWVLPNAPESTVPEDEGDVAVAAVAAAEVSSRAGETKGAAVDLEKEIVKSDVKTNGTADHLVEAGTPSSS